MNADAIARAISISIAAARIIGRVMRGWKIHYQVCVKRIIKSAWQPKRLLPDDLICQKRCKRVLNESLYINSQIHSISKMTPNAAPVLFKLSDQVVWKIAARSESCRSLMYQWVRLSGGFAVPNKLCFTLDSTNDNFSGLLSLLAGRHWTALAFLDRFLSRHCARE